MNFSKMDREEVFSTDMMIGGAFMSNLRDKASALYQNLKPKVDKALSLGRQGVDFAKEHLPSDNALSKWVDVADKGLRVMGRGEDPHEVSAGAKRGRKSGSSKAAMDWRAYSQNLV